MIGGTDINEIYSVDLNLGGQTKKKPPKYRKLKALAKKAFSDLKHTSDYVVYIAFSCIHLSRDKSIPLKRMRGRLQEETEGMKLAQWHIHIVLWAMCDAQKLAKDIKERWIRTAIAERYNITPAAQTIKLCNNTGKLAYVMLQDLHNLTYGHIGKRAVRKEDIARKSLQLLPKVSKDIADVWTDNLQIVYRQFSGVGILFKVVQGEALDENDKRVLIKRCTILTNHNAMKEVVRMRRNLGSKRIQDLIGN